MDLVLYILIIWFLISYAKNFSKARDEITKEASDAAMELMLKLEKVDDQYGNRVILLYNYWTNQFIGQGTTNIEILDLLYSKFANKTISIIHDDNVAIELNLTKPLKADTQI